MKWLALLFAAGCYTVPEPVCGFGCGPAGECPERYECRADRACHLVGSPEQVCRRDDAGVDALDAN